ncbi:MAG: F0F1 ATP synthase subunit epsilon [Nitrospinota bacterium]
MAGSAEKIQLEVVTPERVVLAEEVDYVSAPGARGEFGVLPGHTPMLTAPSIGWVSYRKDGEVRELAVHWGYAEVGPKKVVILAETAERAEEIDVARAEATRERALERLRVRDADVDIDRAMQALERATLRLRLAGAEKA